MALFATPGVWPGPAGAEVIGMTVGGDGGIFAPFVVTSDVDSQVELKVPVVWQSLRLLKSKSDSPMESGPPVICW